VPIVRLDDQQPAFMLGKEVQKGWGKEVQKGWGKEVQKGWGKSGG